MQLKPLLDSCIKIGPKLKTLDLSANDLDDASAGSWPKF